VKLDLAEMVSQGLEVTMGASTELKAIISLPAEQRLGLLVDLAERVDRADESLRDAVRDALLLQINQRVGTGQQRLLLGEALGHLGDPRLRRTHHDNYWVDISFDDGTGFQVGRAMVSTDEFRDWVDSGGYDDDAAWSPEGLAWRARAAHTWLQLASDPEVSHLVVPNQPVVGVTWYEAEAYARSQGARLLTSSERRWVMRGAEKRPYPWGAPFGEGNANTREEALGRPCAIGLYLSDRTPEGVWDLAGNVAEWTSDGSHDQRITHPGSWARPSMASWAKALEMAAPGARSSDLGFRICRD